MSRTFLVLGAAGTGKSTFALSGEGIVDFYEFDPGSFERAAISLQEGKVNLHQYTPPLTALEAPSGKLSLINPAVPQTSHHLAGWSENFWRFVADYLPALDGPGYPVIDTETRFWMTIRQGFLQEVQEATGKDQERLNTLAYTEPNARYSQVLTAPKIKGKDLVLLAHEKESYVNDKPTGTFVHDGYKEAPNLADCTLRFTLQGKVPLATIYKAGTGGLELIGREIQNPTLVLVNAILDGAAKLRRLGMGIPETNDELLQLAAAL